MLSDYGAFIKKLESLGEDSVSSMLSSGRWSAQKEQWTSDWLNKISSRKRDAREEETLAAAKEANRIASEAKDIALSASKSARAQARWAMRAAIIATIAIIIAAIAYIKPP